MMVNRLEYSQTNQNLGIYRGRRRKEILPEDGKQINIASEISFEEVLHLFVCR
jgi:hypothetical protein